MRCTSLFLSLTLAFLASRCGDAETDLDGEDDAAPDTEEDPVQDFVPDPVPDPSQDLPADEAPVEDVFVDPVPDPVEDLPADTPSEDVADDEGATPAGRLLHAGIISSILVSPTDNALFYFFNDWGWNSMGGFLGTATSSGVVSADLGFDSYTIGAVYTDHVGGSRLFYYKDFGYGYDTPLAMADLSSVRAVTYAGGNVTCLHVEEDGFALFVDPYYDEPSEEDWFQTGTIRFIRPGSTTVEEIMMGAGACSLDEWGYMEFEPALSPDRQWLAYYDFAWYTPDWPDIELMLVALDPASTEPPTWVSMLYNSPRAAPAFTPDSAKLLHLDHSDRLAVYPVADPDSAFTFTSSTYPTLSYRVVSSTQVLFSAENSSGDTDMVLGNLETGEETFLGAPHGWGRVTPAQTAGYAYVDYAYGGGLHLLNLSDGTFTLVDTEDLYWTTRGSKPLQLVGDRIIYITGNDTDGYEVRTADPIHGESMRTLVADYVVYLRYDYDDLFEITADGSAILYLDYRDYAVHRTEIATGATTIAAENVIMFRYIRAADQLAVVRGRGSGPALAGDGLYLVP
jgi:hypothetical protein